MEEHVTHATSVFVFVVCGQDNKNDISRTKVKICMFSLRIFEVAYDLGIANCQLGF